jgi:hypothetical protein
MPGWAAFGLESAFVGASVVALKVLVKKGVRHIRRGSGLRLAAGLV